MAMTGDQWPASVASFDSALTIKTSDPALLWRLIRSTSVTAPYHGSARESSFLGYRKQQRQQIGNQTLVSLQTKSKEIEIGHAAEIAIELRHNATILRSTVIIPSRPPISLLLRRWE
ncbi:hypothetical protein L484_027881 [Morus notabilis]|uniref:Uncharacterized protein n=1 Tax=Morus notabilis TaxID=981085 RepID=W9S7G8_9ROSA|nr:hypothetical protein L484_027881 [Morus notabilis]